MSILKSYGKHLISGFILLMLVYASLQSQSPDNKFPWQKRWFIGLSGGPARTEISSNGTPVISGMVTTAMTSYTLSFDAGYYFSKYFGLQTGIGFSPYVTELTLDQYSNTLDTVDSESESYERRIAGSGISETQKLYFLEIPVILNFQCPFGKSAGFYLQGGINLAISVGSDYSGSGTFTYSGYYPAYNVELKDIPYEGFKSNVKNDVNGELKVKEFNPELITSAGFYFHNQKHIQISAGLFYRWMFSDISDYTPAGSFQLSTHEDQMRSLMEGSEKTTAASIGIGISLRYYLR